MHDNQLRRYARNISLTEIGTKGQKSLINAKILVVGAGGLGSASLSYLAAAGVGTLGIVDYDRVELSNLQRQIIFETSDIGRLKTEAAEDRIEELNPDIDVINHTVKIGADNAKDIIKMYDIVLDGSDNFATRFIVNEYCHKLNKPMISGAIRGFHGQLAIFHSMRDIKAPCYQCFANIEANEDRGCKELGVIGALAGIIGALQALEAIKIITSENYNNFDNIFIFEAINLKFRKVKIEKDKTCAVCNHNFHS